MRIEPTRPRSKDNVPVATENDKLEHAGTAMTLCESVMQCRAYIDNLDGHIGSAHSRVSMDFVALNLPSLRTGDKLKDLCGAAVWKAYRPNRSGVGRAFPSTPCLYESGETLQSQGRLKPP